MNRLQTLPREILFEIIDRLSLHEVIRALATLEPCELTADYMCSRAHKRDFASVLAEITAIEYVIMPDLISSERSYRGITTEYSYSEFESSYYRDLLVHSNRQWPVKLVPIEDVFEPLPNRVYRKAYTFDFEKSKYHLLRLITIKEFVSDETRHIFINIMDFKSYTENGEHRRYHF